MHELDWISEVKVASFNVASDCYCPPTAISEEAEVSTYLIYAQDVKIISVTEKSDI